MPKLLFDPNLILESVYAKTADEAVRKVAEHLVRLGYAKGSYPDAVVKREHEFPTGLPTNGVGVAIPHCDAHHVLNPAIAVARLSNPVRFGVMGSKDATVMVDIIFMLAINEPSSQIDTLRQLSLMVQDSGLLATLKNASDGEEVMRILQSFFEVNGNSVLDV